jgi:hypothetical protein
VAHVCQHVAKYSDERQDIGTRHLPNCWHSQAFFNRNPNDSLVKVGPLTAYF